jgi:hypothetical protein
MPTPHKTAISYSWDDKVHQTWVKDFATRLRGDGVDVMLDQWHLGLGDRLPLFMESMIRESRFVLIVGTPGYKDRFDGRRGGAGYEGHIISGEILNPQSTDKFIPVLRSGDWTTSLPTALAAVTGVDLRGTPYVEEQYRILVRKLYGMKDEAPPLGNAPDWLTEPEATTLPLGSVSPATAVEADGGYHREVETWSVTAIDRRPADYWRAANAAILGDAAWPLSLYWHRHTGGDQFVTRQVLSDGFRTEYRQRDVLVNRSELVHSRNPGKVTIRETQEFSNRHRDGGFPYDTAIATVADAIRFAAAFFRGLGLGDANQIAIAISWRGLKGRFITADTFRILPSYQQRRADSEEYTSPVVEFRLAEADLDVGDPVRRLVQGLLNQFDMFDPKPQIYEEVLQHWKNVSG